MQFNVRYKFVLYYMKTDNEYYAQCIVIKMSYVFSQANHNNLLVAFKCVQVVFIPIDFKISSAGKNKLSHNFVCHGSK